MSRRLTDTRQGKAAPTLSLRLTEAMAAEIEQARAALALAAPTGLVVSLSDAARVLLGEALAARRAAAAGLAAAAVLVDREAPTRRSAPVALHTAAEGRISVATPVANDPPAPLTLRMEGLDGGPAAIRPPVKRGRWSPDGSGPVVDREALRRRVETAIAAGHTLRGLAGVAKVDESSLRNWRTGKRGLSEPVARKLSDAVAALDVGAR